MGDVSHHRKEVYSNGQAGFSSPCMKLTETSRIDDMRISGIGRVAIGEATSKWSIKIKSSICSCWNAGAGSIGKTHAVAWRAIAYWV